MGFLDNTTITVDAILTKKGRELLARGDGSFRPTQFALADDEMNYALYNPDHPSGSAYYGEALEALPLLEAFSDETQAMKYKLVTLPRGTARMPILSIGQSTIILKQGESKTITPETLNYLGNNIANSFSLKATTVNTLFGTRTSIQTTVTFIGRDSGARITVPVTINKL